MKQQHTQLPNEYFKLLLDKTITRNELCFLLLVCKYQHLGGLVASLSYLQAALGLSCRSTVSKLKKSLLAKKLITVKSHPSTNQSDVFHLVPLASQLTYTPKYKPQAESTYVHRPDSSYAKPVYSRTMDDPNHDDYVPDELRRLRKKYAVQYAEAAEKKKAAAKEVK